MFTLISILTRYILVFYIGYFLFQGVLYILIERNMVEGEMSLASKKQRYSVVLMHIICFSIISVYQELFIDQRIYTALFGLSTLTFIFLSFYFTNKLYKNGCPLLFNGVIFLIDIGFIVIFRLDPTLAEKQFIFAALGFVVLLILPLAFRIVPKFEKLQWIYLAIALPLLISTLIIGDATYGAKNWISIGAFGFQPSEFVKILFVLFFASAMRKEISFKNTLFLCGVGATFIIILVLQKDLGGSLIFFMTFMMMLYVRTGSELLFFTGMIGASFSAFVAFKLFAHVQQRVEAWQNPWKDIGEVGYQITQSLFAIGSVGLFGSGLMLGSPNKIPVVTKDFIFSAISEEFGPIFALLLIGVYIMVFYRCIHIALRSSKEFHSLITVGFTSMLVFQTFIIIAGVIKMIPMTGVTLPFISYGGSSIFTTIIIIGFLQFIYSNNYNRSLPELP